MQRSDSTPLFATPDVPFRTIPPYLCLPHLLQGQAEQRPDALAIVAPGRLPLTYRRLHAHLDDVLRMLHAMGVRRHDRVGLVLPNGPEMAVALLTVTAGATCVPLNPAYGAYEFDSYLATLSLKALIIQQDMDSPARVSARARGVRIIELTPLREAEAGLFALRGEAHVPLLNPASAQPEDVAFVLLTSGTTARPKLVPLTHRNVCSSAHNTRVVLALGAHDRGLNMLPLFHSYSLITNLIASLMAGARIACAPGFDIEQCFAWMAAFRPTWYPGVPTIHQAILERALDNREIIARCPLRFILSAGMSLLPRVLADLERVFQVPVIEFYGMTEASSQITSNPLPPHARKPGSVGVAIGSEVAIMDEAGTVLPVAVTGEIVIRGPNVIAGYEDNPEANQAVFIDGWFRTGDEGFLDTDGYLFITGRLKEMINRGGEKIAPGEVDAVLMEHPDVVQAIAFAVPHARLGEDVAAAVMVRQNATATASDIRQFVAQRLAPFKIPQQVLIVADLPKNATGKLQRIGLAEKLGLTDQQQVSSARHAPFAAPRTTTEERLAELWNEVLQRDHVDIHANFFQLGGDSILAMQLIARVQESVGVDGAVLDFFAAPTVADMARNIERAGQAILDREAPSLPPVSTNALLPLSYSQERLWFLEQLGPSSHAYIVIEALRLRGPLNVVALEQSLLAIVRRHEVFRTTFTTIDGQPWQVVDSEPSIYLAQVDLQELSRHEQEQRVRTLALEEVRKPFDLNQGPLLRPTLLRLAVEEYILLLTMHHIVVDGWSLSVLWRELTQLYTAFVTAQAAALPALPRQYTDFSRWQRQRLQGDVLDPLLAYWRQQLAGMAMLQLPTDRSHPEIRTFRGAKHLVTFSWPVTQGLKALSQQHDATLFMTLLAVFQVLLHRYTDQDDIAVGSLVANRQSVETEGLIGFFVNTMVLRTSLAGDPRFQELLRRVRKVALGAYRHQELPFEKLLEELRPQRDLSRNPLFQVLFVLQNTPQETLALPGVALSSVDLDPQTAKFDLTLDLRETAEGLQGFFEYNTDVFEAATIARMEGHLQTLLAAILADPAQRLGTLPLLTAYERHQSLVAWNTTSADYPVDQCIHQMFEDQVARTPDAVALVYAETCLTYHELNRRANQLAHHLLALGVKPEDRVGLCMERCLDLVVGLLGILKAGGAYVPLDPAYPPERLAFMLEDAQVPVLVTQTHLTTTLPEHAAVVVCMDAEWAVIAQQSDVAPAGAVTADNLAYVLYTSGSTGKPKGVLGLHRAVVNAVTWMWQAFPSGAQEVCCQKTSISFGDSIQELLGPLLHGIQSVLIPATVLQEPSQFVQILAAHRVTRMILVPSLLRMLLETYSDLESRLPDLRLWFAGGEMLSPGLCQRFRQCLPNCRLINLYGTSETSDDVTWYDTALLRQDATTVPIGRPITNMQVYVLDRYRQPVPVGVAGELYIGGVGLTRGYLQRPALTADAFIPHPFRDAPGARLYKTGDLVRYLPDGNIELLRRIDQQSNLRGYRIEPGEIEAILERHAAIRQAVVLVRDDLPGDARLVAYLVTTPESVPTPSVLRRFLKTQLPDYMAPAAYVFLDAFPLTPSNKVDRQALPAPAQTRPDLEGAFVASRTPTEEMLAGIWTAVLGVDHVGVHDNFFDLGGHSLMAMQVMSRVRDAWDVEVPVRTLFDAPTVAELAWHIDVACQAERRAPELPIIPVLRAPATLVTMAQEQLWILAQLLPDAPYFNVSHALRLTGALNIEALAQSFTEIITRHEVLRTTFASVDGEVAQIITPAQHAPLLVEDLLARPNAEQEGEALRLAKEEAQRPFDLTQAPLLRVRLLRLAGQEYVLILTMHHMISDIWSMGVLAHELAVLYDAFATGAPSPLPALPIQYADFAHWQRQRRISAARDAQLAYWRQQLRDPLPQLELPTDRPRTATVGSRTAREVLEIPRELAESLTRLSRHESSTLFMTLLAAFNTFLYRYTGQTDLCVATHVANRNRQETEGLIGFLVNTVLLRTDLDGNPTFREVLQRVRETTLAAYANQDLPFEDLVQALERDWARPRTSLCQVMFILQNAMMYPLTLPGLTLRPLEGHESVLGQDMMLTTFDVILVVSEGEHGLVGSCIYQTALFDAATINRMLDDFQHVLARIVSQPEQQLSAFAARDDA